MLTHLVFADDMFIIARRREDLLEMCKHLLKAMTSLGLAVQESKL